MRAALYRNCETIRILSVLALTSDANRPPMATNALRLCKVACICRRMFFQAVIIGWSSSTAFFLSSWSRFLASKEGFQSLDTVFRVGYGLLGYCSFVMLLMHGCSSDFINFSGRSRSCDLRIPDRTPFSFNYSWMDLKNRQFCTNRSELVKILWWRGHQSLVIFTARYSGHLRKGIAIVVDLK